jgi:hypothetical protein
MLKSTWKLGVAALAGSLVMMTLGASAQTTAPAPVTPVAPKVAPAAPATPAAAPTTTTAKAKAAIKAATTLCKGKDEATCKGDTACSWVVPKAANAKGTVTAAYCRNLAGAALKAKAKAAAKATGDAAVKAGKAVKAAVTPPAAAPAGTTPAPATPKQ